MPIERLLAERLAAIQAGVPGIDYDTPTGRERRRCWT